MGEQLKGRKIAIVATDGFEQSELTSPLAALREAGAGVHVIAPKSGAIQGMKMHEKGEMVTVDATLDHARPEEYDALVLPGGVANPDSLRTDPRALAFVQHFVASGKPIAAICHGPWTLIEMPGFLKGRTVTSWPSLRTDLTNAGAKWVDQAVVSDHGLITSRNPGDLPAFNAKIIEEFAGSRQPARSAA